MDIFISGFYEQDALELGYAQDGQVNTQWLDPEDFILEKQQANTAASDQKWIWLYRSPWSLLVARTKSAHEDLADFPRQWNEFQGRVLKLRHLQPNFFFLVNRDTTSARELNDSLNLEPPVSVKKDILTSPGLSLAVSKLFEWIHPSSWEVFEALEAVAWIPNGEPLFRHAITPPNVCVLMELVDLLHAGRLLPGSVAEIATTTRTAEDAAEKLKNLQKENELILLQLHQVQEEFETCILANQHMTLSLRQTQETMERARVLISKLIIMYNGVE